jgi:hypothetical protein
LANAAQAVRRAIADNVDIVIVNKFGKREAGGVCVPRSPMPSFPDYQF